MTATKLRKRGGSLIDQSLRLGLVALCWVGLVAGCATDKVSWASRIGQFTYDQAVLDYGPPDNSAKLSDGTTVCDWLTSRGYAYGSTYRGFRDPYLVQYWERPAPNFYLRLTFDPAGKLRDWKKVVK